MYRDNIFLIVNLELFLARHERNHTSHHDEMVYYTMT